MTIKEYVEKRIKFWEEEKDASRQELKIEKSAEERQDDIWDLNQAFTALGELRPILRKLEKEGAVSGHEKKRCEK